MIVLRSTYEAALDRAERAEARADRFMAQYHSVVERMLEMKREGFTTKPVIEPMKPAESAIPPEVEFSIEQRAGGDPFYRRYLTNFAQAELARGTATETIQHRITHGDEDDD